MIISWWQSPPESAYRNLCNYEIAILEQNRNRAFDWSLISVKNGFDAKRVIDCSFYGKVLIGCTEKEELSHGNMRLATGLYRSHFSDTVIGDNACIHNLLYCHNQIIGKEVLIFNTAEISADEKSMYGMGILLDQNGSITKKPLEIINENGGRAVFPFPGMTCSDAFLWAKYRDDERLMERLEQVTLATCSKVRPPKGVIADGAVLINCRSVRDAIIGPHAFLEQAESVRNATVLSDRSEASYIGASVQIKDSIVGCGNKIDSAVQLSTVVTGTAVSISQSARISHTYIGDNAAISCCEIANSLLMPSHAQHHNNSFLIACMIGGQSNIAAGATIGSNHTSRVNDGELWAGRGFWPGLCTSFKHNSRFASFIMCAKGDYPSELDIKLPFSLILLDSANELLIFPAFWFTHNMYAVMRSALKFKKRDKRVHRLQYIEHEILAPDTIEEMFSAIRLLELWTGKAFLASQGAKLGDKTEEELVSAGKEILARRPSICSSLKINAEKAEKGRYETPLKNVAQAWKAYRSMIRVYCVQVLIPYMMQQRFTTITELREQIGTAAAEKWVNLGSMVITGSELEKVKKDIMTDQKAKTWSDINQEFSTFTDGYENRKINHAFLCAARLAESSPEKITDEQFRDLIKSAADDVRSVARLTQSSRNKDFSDPFRSMVYDSAQEMELVTGTAQGDSVVRETLSIFEGMNSLIKDFLGEQ